MPIPFLIAGAAALAGATAVETAAVGVAAAVLTSDKKKEPEAKTSREKISASDVPDDIRRQIEGSRQVEGSRRSHRTDVKYSPQQYYEMGMEYYYGRNGRPINRTTAEVFLRRAAGSGHEAAGRQMRTLFG